MATSMRQLHSRQAATNAQCLSQYDWVCSLELHTAHSMHTHALTAQMNNAKNQTPCLIASWSVVPCQENCELPTLFMFTRKLRCFTAWIIPAISSAPYTGPRPGSALFQCQCNTVHYSLVAACGACQGFHGDEGAVKYVPACRAV